MPNGYCRDVSGTLHYEETEDGRIFLCLVVDDEVVLKEWRKKDGSKAYSGKKSRYCFGECFNELSAEEQVALSGIRNEIGKGCKLKSRRKTLLSRREEMLERLGGGRKAAELLKSLKEKGAIREEDGAFFVERKFIFRG